MKILIFGKAGQLAQQFKVLTEDKNILQLGSDQANFLKPDEVVSAIRNYQPTHIINASAYTAVDKAESEKETALQINANILGVIGEEAKKIRCHVIHFSTDYVYDGLKNAAYTEDDATDSVNYYGHTKLQGDLNLMQSGCSAFIFRVAWVYGPSGNNFLKTILRLAETKSELKVVNDQKGTPTSSYDIADSVMEILKDPSFTEKSGLYHLTPQGETTWFSFAQKILVFARSKPEKYKVIANNLFPISTAEYPTLAKRPQNSLMSSAKLKENFGIEIADWTEGLTKVFDLL